jgi:hypothetical protein
LTPPVATATIRKTGDRVIQRDFNGCFSLGIQRNTRLPQKKCVEQFPCMLSASASALRQCLQAEVAFPNDLYVGGCSADPVAPSPHHGRQDLPAPIRHQLEKALIHSRHPCDRVSDIPHFVEAVKRLVPNAYAVGCDAIAPLRHRGRQHLPRGPVVSRAEYPSAFRSSDQCEAIEHHRSHVRSSKPVVGPHPARTNVRGDENASIRSCIEIRAIDDK